MQIENIWYSFREMCCMCVWCSSCRMRRVDKYTNWNDELVYNAISYPSGNVCLSFYWITININFTTIAKDTSPVCWLLNEIFCKIEFVFCLSCLLVCFLIWQKNKHLSFCFLWKVGSFTSKIGSCRPYLCRMKPLTLKYPSLIKVRKNLKI